MSSRLSRFEKFVMYAYLVLLPVTSGFYRDSLHSLSYSASFLPHLAGLLLMAFHIGAGHRVYRPSRLVKQAIFIVMALNVSSLVMAIVQYQELSPVLGRNTVTAVLPQISYYIQIIFVLLYNDYILSHVPLSKIIKIIVTSIVSMVVIGYMEILVLVGGGAAAMPILSAINRLFFMDEVYVEIYRKVNLLTPEASTAGAYMSIWMLPLLLTLLKYKKIKPWLGYTLIISLVPIVIFNNSSSGFFGLLVCLAVFLFFLPVRQHIAYFHIRLYLILGMLLGAAVFWSRLKNSNFFQMAFVKVVDTENLSTLHRTTSIYTNLLSFLHHPLLGVGNGIQGFYYLKYFPQWGFGSYESEALYYGEVGWPGSGAFLPTFLSAFGLFGLAMLLYLMIGIRSHLRTFDASGNYLREFMAMSFACMMFQFYTTADIIGNFYILFVVSLACYGSRALTLSQAEGQSQSAGPAEERGLLSLQAPGIHAKTARL